MKKLEYTKVVETDIREVFNNEVETPYINKSKLSIGESDRKSEIKNSMKHGDNLTNNEKDLLAGFDANWDPTQGYPNLKLERMFYFGGMRRNITVPLSMPNRVIVEPNPPR